MTELLKNFSLKEIQQEKDSTCIVFHFLNTDITDGTAVFEKLTGKTAEKAVHAHNKNIDMNDLQCVAFSIIMDSNTVWANMCLRFTNALDATRLNLLAADIMQILLTKVPRENLDESVLCRIKLLFNAQYGSRLFK